MRESDRVEIAEGEMRPECDEWTSLRDVVLARVGGEVEAWRRCGPVVSGSSNDAPPLDARVLSIRTLANGERRRNFREAVSEMQTIEWPGGQCMGHGPWSGV